MKKPKSTASGKMRAPAKAARTAKPGVRAKPAARRGRTAAVKARPPAAIKGRTERQVRQEIIETALTMSRTGLSPGRSGNVSARWADGMLITPTGMPYENLKPADIAFVSTAGKWPPNGRKPSSEWRFHLSAYRARPEMHAIVHTHSLNATVLACAHQPIPAFHYMVAVAGGTDISLVPYAPFGTEELAQFVAEGLANRNACLMANHGQIAIGASLAAALELAQEVETLAAQYVRVLALGKPHILGEEQMADVLVRFKAYGQNAQKS